MWWSSRRAQRLSELREAVHQASLAVKRLEDRLSLLEGAHERLRGRFYSLRGSPGEPVPKTKEEILRDFHAARK
jgi:hypothetical protein